MPSSSIKAFSPFTLFIWKNGNREEAKIKIKMKEEEWGRRGGLKRERETHLMEGLIIIFGALNSREEAEAVDV